MDLTTLKLASLLQFVHLVSFGFMFMLTNNVSNNIINIS